MDSIAAESDRIQITSERITWSENLRRAFTGLFTHALFPLIDVQLSYDCLLSREDFCQVKTSSATTKTKQIARDVKPISHIGYDGTLSQRPPGIFAGLYNKLFQKGAIEINELWSSLILLPLMPLAQLTICTILISRQIYKDTKRVVILASYRFT